MRSHYTGTLLGVSGLDEDQALPENAGGSHRIFEVFSILIGFLLVASSFLANVWWFRAVALAFAGVFTVWGGWILWPSFIARLDARRGRVKQASAARSLYPDFLDLLKRFHRYTDSGSNRADTVQYYFWALSQRNELNLRLPLDTAAAHYPSQFYDHLRSRAAETPPLVADFRQLLEGFGDLLQLYHRIYALWPYEELRRSPNIAQIPAHERDGLVVQIDEYNAFLRDVKAFGRRINEVLEDESFFPIYFEMLKPLP